MKPDLAPPGDTPTPAAATAEPVPTATPPSRRPRRRILWAGLGLALLAIGLAGAWYWWTATTTVAPTPPMPENIDDVELRQALEEARARVQAKPRSPAAWGDLGLLFLGHQCYLEADICLAQASRLDSANARWPYYRSFIAPHLDPDQALPLLREAQKHADALPPEHRTALLLKLAEMLLEQEGGLDEAEALFREALQQHPDNDRAAYGLGEVALARGDNQLAIRLLTPLTQPKAGPQYARKKAALHMANLYRRMGDRAAAQQFEYLLTILVSDVDWNDPLLDAIYDSQTGEVIEKKLVVQCEKRGEFREAARLYQERIAHGRQITSSYMGAGVNLIRARDYDQGLLLLREGWRLDPDNSYPLYRIAEALMQRATDPRETPPDSAKARQWLREAAESARQATRLKQDYAAAYLLQGQALLLLAEPTDAIAPLWWGVKCRPEGFKQQYYLGLALLESACWYRPHYYRQAAIHLQNAQELEPTNPEATKALQRLDRRWVTATGR
jgi:cytochrome c-type biogenesis protein CcmH/NrfG